MRVFPLNRFLTEHFAAKVFVIFIALLVIVTLAFTTVSVRQQNQALKDALLRNGSLLSKLLAYNSRIGVFSENKELLKDPVDGVIQQEDVIKVSLFNQDGELLIETVKPGTDIQAESENEDPAELKRIIDNMRTSGLPYAGDHDEWMEFWSPVVSSSGYSTDDSLFFGRESSEKEERIIGFARLTVDERPLFRRMDALLLNSILIGLASLVIGSVFVYLLVRRVTGPLNRLTEGVRGIGRGEDVEELPEETADEIGKLATAFNNMSGSLRSREAALRESEEKYRQLFELESDALFLIDDLTGVILEVNLTASRMYGYSREEMLGMNERDISVTEEGLPGHHDPGSASAIEYYHRRKDGTVFPVEISVTRLSWHGKDVRISAVRDETERLKAQVEHAKLEDKLRQAQKMEAIGTLAGGIAHDFNNILGIIVVNTELAMYEIPEDGQAHENLEEVMKACIRARDMVRQILAFSRKDETRTKPVMVTPLVKESVKLFRSSMLDNMEIIQDIRSKWDVVMADPTQIHQVLMNLYNNAAYSLKESGGTITVSSDNIEIVEEKTAGYQGLPSGKYLRLSVSDTGRGIQPDILDRIFDPYFTTKKFGEGTGMGLAIVHGIVKSHGGLINVESEPGKGAVFNVLLPVIEADIRIEDEYNILCPTGTERILFVDDEKPISDAMKLMLGRLGYEVTSSTDSTDALRLFRENSGAFDVIITDLVMPKMTGLEFSRAVMDIRPDIPVILCTGYSDMVDDEMIIKAGIRHRTSKPLLMSEMANLIREALDQPT